MIFLLRAVALMLLCSCTVTRSPRPVGSGQAAVAASGGGPFFKNLGTPVPLPMTAVYGRYGLDDRTDLDVGIQMPVVRTIGVDIGATHMWLTQDGARPAISGGGRLALVVNSKALIAARDPDTGQHYGFNPRLFEELFATASWQVHPDWLVWSGLDLMMQIEHGSLRPSVLVGASWRLAQNWDVSGELKWLSFASNQSALAVNWAGIDGYGALALQLGATWYLGNL